MKTCPNCKGTGKLRQVLDAVDEMGKAMAQVGCWPPTKIVLPGHTFARACEELGVPFDPLEKGMVSARYASPTGMVELVRG